MFYEEFYNNMFNSNESSSGEIDAEKDKKRTLSFESTKIISSEEIDAIYPLSNLSVSKRISRFYGLEDDNPFADIGEDTGTDDTGGDDNPFGGIGDDTGDDGGFFDDLGDDSGDFFGDSGGDNEGEGKKNPLVLDREKSIKEDFSMSMQVRSNFPEKFLQLKDIINTNISIIERSVPETQDIQEVFSGLIREFQRTQELVDAYISVMPKKPYEDIFSTYVALWSTMKRLKDVFVKVTNSEELDEENIKELITI